MSILISPKDLTLTFIKDAKSQIKCLEELLATLKNDYDGTDNSMVLSDPNNNPQRNAPIDIGCRVEIDYGNGQKKTGRVWGRDINKDIYQINKDGLVNYENIPGSRLKNLSIGYLPEIEKNIWVTETKITDYKGILKDSESPVLFENNGLHIVEIVKIDNFYPCNIIHFVMAANLRSGKLKLPQQTITTVGFYEMKITNNEIVEINFSSKTAFEMTYATKNNLTICL